MKVNVVKMEHKHINELLEKGRLIKFYVTPKHVDALVAYDHSYAAIGEDGRVIGVAGVVEKWNERAEAWAIIDEDSRKYFISFHNAVKKFLKLGMWRRIEATVQNDLEVGHRWMKLLGFKKECGLMRNYGVEGEDFSLYSFIRGVD